MNDDRGFRMNDNRGFGYNNNSTVIDFKKYKGTFKLFGIFIGVILLAVIFFSSFTFVVDEREQAVVRQFSKVVKVIVDEKTDEIVDELRSTLGLSEEDIVEGKGLFLKMPFLQTVEKYTNMLLTYDTNTREVTTLDKKKLVLDNFAQWRIKNPALFSISFKTIGRAQSRIDDIVYSKLNEEIGRVDAITVISDKDYVTEMLRKITDNSNIELKDYGIEIADIRIKRTDFPEENYNNIFNRMRTERQKDAAKYRSEGMMEAQKIKSQADKEAQIIEANAYAEAQKLRGEGEAEALRIYADAYNRDPEFYKFWRTLQSYKKTLRSNTKIIIDPKSEFAEYLFGPGEEFEE